MAPKKKSPVEKNPEYDAWFTSFFLRNHIDPFAYPNEVGTREQVEFMVYPEPDLRYYPCSDRMFETIMSRKDSSYLKQAYESVLDRIMTLVDDTIRSRYDAEFLKALIRIKYEDETRTGLLIPSRLEKRLYKVFLSRTHIENPYTREKASANRAAARFLSSKRFVTELNRLEPELNVSEARSLSGIRQKILEIELTRRLSLLAHPELWTDRTRLPSEAAIRDIFHTPMTGNGLGLLKALCLGKSQKILWLADQAGEIMADLAIARFLTRLGHLVILAVKEAPIFQSVCLADTRTDPALAQALEGAHFIHGQTISKNTLVKLLKHDNHLYVVSDGTREELNLLLASTTFSRIFKEADFIISRGDCQKRRLIDCRFHFTQTIINITARNHTLGITRKPRHPSVIKFSHQQLEEKAGAIISQMKKAREKGMTVMFYSGIIGSIPGKIDVAKKIMSTFIAHLEKRSDDLFIINPSQYYEPGMDADDLMYMWEIVQRSSFIDIWRFQTSDDIAESFSLLRKNVPPEWIGKDATYSTGCTKEMRIAQDVLRKNPEMQLMGPSLDRFMRRDEYGVGSMYDRRLARA